MLASPKPLTVLSDAQGVFKIPYFQRAYVWEKANWEEMIEGLLDPDPKRGHFLGTLIIKRVETGTGDDDIRHVIDGQQRLTTLSILLRAVFDSLPESNQINAKEAGGIFNTCLFYKKKQTESTWYIKIEHSKVNREDYQRVIENGIPAEEIDNIDWKNCTSKILRCYKHFIDKLKCVPEVDRINLFESLLNKNNNLFVLIDLQGDENEQAIFDTINSAGVRLSSADIIKNALFQRVLDLNKEDQATVEKLYNDGWKPVFAPDEKTEDTVAFWETKRTTGRLQRDNLEILLHSFAIIEGFFDPEEHKLEDLAKRYKERINELDENALKRMIMSIKEHAELYRENFPVFDKSDLFGYDDNTKRLFHILDVCDTTTFHPYILYLYRRYKDQKTELESALKRLETLVIRRAICKSETKNYNKWCKEFICDSSKIRDRLSETTDDNVKNGLSNIGNRHASLILFWVELYRRNKGYQDKDNLKYCYSLEHIMPQQWQKYWKVVPIIGENGDQMDAESVTGEECRKRHVYSIGNMTLLKSSLNSALQNHSFQVKIGGDGSKKKTINDYAELSITKQDIVRPYEEGDKVWDEVKIRNRAEKIASEVLEIWSV